MRRALQLALAALALTFASPSAHALENETLLVAMPKAYKVGHQQRAGNRAISEFVPQAETVKNWTEIVTVNIFFGLRDVTPAEYRANMQRMWTEACAGSEFSKVKEGVENGYPTLTWFQKCPMNKQTGKPEFTWMKAIQGRDSFYLVQKAFKFDPSAVQRKEWGGYLDSVRVCDTRLADRPCKMGS
jgi:hypothetical protein